MRSAKPKRLSECGPNDAPLGPLHATNAAMIATPRNGRAPAIIILILQSSCNALWRRLRRLLNNTNSSARLLTKITLVIDDLTKDPQHNRAAGAPIPNITASVFLEVE